MDKLLYISDYPLKTKSGHGNMIDMHHAILREIFGSDNIVECYGNCTEEKMDDKKRIYRFKESSKLDKLFAVLAGNPPYLYYNFERKILKLIKTIDFKYLFIENSVSGNLLKKIKALRPDIVTVVYFPDIEQDLMGQQVKGAKLYRKISLTKMIDNEKITAKVSDKQIVLNNRDYDLFNQYYGYNPTCIAPVIVSNNEVLRAKQKHQVGEKLTLLFVGVDYYPNVQGVQWFIDKVIPLVKADFVLQVVGYNMEKYKNEWQGQSDKVNVIGTVERLSNYYNSASIVIAPIFQGGGMKVKTAEALSYGKIIIGTSESTFGYIDTADDVVNRLFFSCDNEYDFARVIDNLAQVDFNLCNDEIIDWMKREYSYESNLAKIAELFV